MTVAYDIKHEVRTFSQVPSDQITDLIRDANNGYKGKDIKLLATEINVTIAEDVLTGFPPGFEAADDDPETVAQKLEEVINSHLSITRLKDYKLKVAVGSSYPDGADAWTKDQSDYFGHILDSYSKVCTYKKAGQNVYLELSARAFKVD